MRKTQKGVSFWAAVAMGVGAMVGAGIFALMGTAGAIAGSAVWISFVIGGGIALLSGYSFGRMGARYPAAGGLVEYLVQGFGPGRFSGTMSVMMYLGAIVGLSLVARTFGTYAVTLMPQGTPQIMVPVMAGTVVLAFMILNLGGARAMARVETLVVVIKMAVLVVFAIAGLIFIDPAQLSPATYPPTPSILFSVAITFFAYEGFRVITNAAEDMDNPARTLPRAIMTSILLVMVVYVALALSVFGNLPPEKVIAAQDYALAEAARPAFGQTGFTIVAIAALFSTASAINAALFAVTNVGYEMARKGELPHAFGTPVGHSREGLLISGGLILLMALFFDLSAIAEIGAISMLMIHMVTHIGHLRLIRETGANRGMIWAAVLANGGAVTLGVWHLIGTKPIVLFWILCFGTAAFVIEMLLHSATGRTIATRTPRRGT
ncbi:APC family permease [Mesobacterium sp. TK19101]|uniref:APC family permease n=1 Tax=Mesobacterium hydrothermale TaxID=3111907 RepID=A0ABU6HMK4_9RHOB|nr:APC family permease [Mesobacterium sp. TK19101]MEC3863091.1 APC family permease [Mesobacterium sp. TK19101]